MANKTVLGVFSTQEDAEKALSALDHEGVTMKDVSIITQNREAGATMAQDSGANVAGGAATGAIIGGIAGLLLSAVALPGVGGLLVAGPLAATWGVTGLVAGGIIGALAGLGVPEETARSYEERIRQGAIVLAVPVKKEGQETLLASTMEDASAEDVRVAERGDVSTMTQSDQIHSDGYADHYYDDDVAMGKFLRKDVSYPISKHDLLNDAKQADVDNHIQTMLDNVPNQKFSSAEDVMNALENTKSRKTSSTKSSSHVKAHKADTQQAKHKKTAAKANHHGHVNPVQVQKFLKNVDYPASKQEILKTAKKEGADKNVLMTLDELENDEFNSPKDISHAIGRLE